MKNFKDFWPFYVRQHSNPISRRLHFVGSTLGLLCLSLAITKSAAFIVIGLGLGYSLAWIGHFFFERNRPATFKHPLWSFRADLRMYRLMWMRKMDLEIDRFCPNFNQSRDRLPKHRL